MIIDHQRADAISSPSPNRSGYIDPKFIVMHYTASWEVDSVIQTFSSRKSKVSAHATVDTDGMIYQHVPFNVKAWHAGPSSYAGYNGMNSHSIGIEIVNPGFCRMHNGNMYDANGDLVRGWRDMEFVEQRHPRVGSGTFFWPKYTDIQIETAKEMSIELIAHYNILGIVSHEEIDQRGWKTDPGPAFPMKQFQKLIPERNLDSDLYEVTARSLNVRGGPGTGFKVIAQLTKGALVEVQDRRGDWCRVDDDGWVHEAYLRLA